MKRKILLADDETQMRCLLARALAREPYELIGLTRLPGSPTIERGDAVLRETARVLVDAARSVCADAFIGHIGGDDFVIMLPVKHAAVIASRVTARLRARDREVRWRDFPLLSLSIGVATAGTDGRDGYSRIVRAASEMKAWCKAQPERGLSRFGFDRRGHARVQA